MKYKVGDRIRIREDLKIGQCFGECWITQKMHDLSGKTARITEVNADGTYRIDLSPHRFYWTDEMFEDMDMEVQGMNKRVVIEVEEDKIVARCGDKKGIARCHPDDKFDFYVGAKLALERLEDAEKPYAWLKKGVRYYVPAFRKELYTWYVNDADSWDKEYMKHGIVFQTKEEAITCAHRMLAAVKQEG